MDIIKIRGARQHNLKNIDLDIPKNKLVVMTGVSGSGKSSLAFDTIYAEGQRRYVESLSAYARQFLGIMDKPDVDLIEGLSPSISIDQKTVSHNPRSTVGTITEIYDYLRLLYAKIGHPHCPDCGIEIAKLSVDEIVKKIIENILKRVQDDKIKPHLFNILSPVVRQRKGEFRDLMENLKSKGFSELIIDNKKFSLNDEINLIKSNKHNINVIVDKISLSFKQIKDAVFMANLRSKLANSVEQALNLSDGLIFFNDKLFSEKFACSNCGLSLPEIEPRMFSFNSPIGACEKCKGLGTVYKVDPDLVLNKRLSIMEGGIVPFSKLMLYETWYIRLIKTVADDEGIDLNLPLFKLNNDKINVLLYGTGKTYRVIGKNRFGNLTAIHESFDGIINEIEKRYFENSDSSGYVWQKYFREEICDKCLGNKLKPEVLAITINGENIAQLTDKSVADLKDYLSLLEKKINLYEIEISKQILKEIQTRLKFLDNVGLSYLTISRRAKTLSGGELQRIRLASQIGTGLTGVLYVLDEPSIGLHPKDLKALIKTLKQLVDIGNSLIVVEHDKDTIEAADHLIELGPKAGKNGGKIVFTGTVEKMKNDGKSLTGQYLSGKRSIENRNKNLVKNKGEIILRGANKHNLQNVTVKLPLGNLIAVTGVSGSGKSTLVVETIYPALKYYLEGHYHEKIGDFTRFEGYQYLDHAYLVDQSPIGRTPRSNPATYIGFFDEIRDIFANVVEAKASGFKKGRFSFNVKGGRCEKCQGAGVIKIEMQFLSDVYVTCDVCQGMKYNKETLEIRFKGKNINDVLEMTVDEALDFFSNHFLIYQKLIFLKNVGLGYIKLGQSATTFSGGEAQRIKLANELSRKEAGKTLYILDEPTTGLHFYDVDKLLHTLYELVNKGNTVIIIEHNLEVIKNCQYIIDLGPEGGENGGKVIYQGDLNGILETEHSYTSSYLAKIM